MKDQDSGGGSKSNCWDWYASCDHMPPGPQRFKVTGQCTFPTTGYSVELKPTRAGINPRIYMLEKIVHAPTQPVLQVETVVDVNYEKTTDAEYDQVHIRPDGPVIDVKHLE